MKTWLSIVVGSLVSLGILWWTSLPLGVPGEWTWERTTAEPDAIWNLASGVVAASLLIAFVMRGRRRFETFSETSRFPFEMVGWLAGLVVLGFAWLWIVQEISPIKCRVGKSAFVLYYPSSSGYFTRARYDDPRAIELLAKYEGLMREGDVLHTGTHPPGLFLVFHGLITLCKSSPELAAILDATQPSSFREACDVIYSNTSRGHPLRTLMPLDRRVLWLATLIVMLIGSLAVIPLYGIVRRTVSAANAWTCAALWPAVPALAIFIPKSDAVFPCLGLLLLWIWLCAWDRRSLFLSLLAGLMTWCCLMCSLAFLPVLLAAFCLTLGSNLVEAVWQIKSTRSSEAAPGASAIPGVRHGLCVLAAVAGGVIPSVMLGQFAHINVLTVWWWNYQNHAGFYREYPRDYWKWLLVNPLELSLAAGWPLVFLAMCACVRAIALSWRDRGQKWPAQTVKVIISLTMVWGILWVTGKNSGEAARLWLLFMPWLIWLASFQVESLLSQSDSLEVRQRFALQILTLQFLVCLLTVTRVSGFHFD